MGSAFIMVEVDEYNKLVGVELALSQKEQHVERLPCELERLQNNVDYNRQNRQLKKENEDLRMRLLLNENLVISADAVWLNVRKLENQKEGLISQIVEVKGKLNRLRDRYKKATSGKWYILRLFKGRV